MTRVLGSRQQPGAFFFLEHKTFSDFFLDDFRQLFGKALAKTASALPLLPQRRRSPSSLQKAIINKSPNTKFKVLPASRLFLEIRKRGYDGCLTQVKRVVRAWRSEGQERAFVRFETAPGEQ